MILLFLRKMMKMKFFSIFFVFIFIFAYAKKDIYIDLSKQKIFAIEDNKIVICSKISSGKKGHETITGDFKVIYKDKDHKSNIYPKKKNGGAKMPYTIMFHNGGYAIHSGYVPNRRASHGCVRVPRMKAKELFEWVTLDTKIKIANSLNMKKYKYIKVKKRKRRIKQKRKKYKIKKKIYYKGWEDPWG